MNRRIPTWLTVAVAVTIVAGCGGDTQTAPVAIMTSAQLVPATPAVAARPSATRPAAPTPVATATSTPSPTTATSTASEPGR